MPVLRLDAAQAFQLACWLRLAADQLDAEARKCRRAGEVYRGSALNCERQALRARALADRLTAQKGPT